MKTRRQFIGQGFAGLASILAAQQVRGLVPKGLASRGMSPSCRNGALKLSTTRPLFSAPLSPYPTIVGGLPYQRWFSGDDFPADMAMPFHTPENVFPGGHPPKPTEKVKLCVVGGGMSGLSIAYMLRHHKPVVLELHDRFGGVSQGNTWSNTSYSLGGAYVIAPDPGSFLDSFYTDLGLPDIVRVDEQPSPIEINGEIYPGFWEGAGMSPEDQAAFAQYAKIVALYGDALYPDLPFDQPFMQELDRLTFKTHIEQEMGMPVPPLLAGAIQAYCYSSFSAGWEEISAAAGWNFLAAEEFGRWVFPGGNAAMTDIMWQRLAQLEADTPIGCSPQHLRGGCTAVDVRIASNGYAQVTYKDKQGLFHSLLAKRVVMACPKHVCTQVLHDAQTIDPPKFAAMDSLEYRAYVVANVLLDRSLGRDFYDIFLLRDGSFPTSDAQAQEWFHPSDTTAGDFAQSPDGESVLTLYWPLPYGDGRFTLLLNDPMQHFAQRLSERIHELLGVTNTPVSAVKEIRLTRWGHAMPISEPGFIASGAPQQLLRPYEGAVYFVNQDNWALPAVENCLIDANNIMPEIDAAL